MAKLSQAYIRLAEIDWNCRQYAAGMPTQDETKTLWSGIGFALNGKHFVSPMGEIAEILSVPKVTKVPGVGNWVRGIANVRGRLLPVLDMVGYFFGKASKRQARRRRLLVIEYGEFYSGLVVDEVFGMQHFSITSYQTDCPDSIDEALVPLINGAYTREGQCWPVFSPLRLIEDPKFMKLAS